MKVKGTIDYQGPDDPPMEYYKFKTSDGKVIMIGFITSEWAGNIHDGIPCLPKTEWPCELEINLLHR